VVAGLRQLAAFEAVARELHFGRAAAHLGIGQAAVSQLIRRLEEEQGVVLFERSSHHVTLTAAGAHLLGPASRVLAAERAFVDAAQAIVSGAEGVLRIATSDATARPLAVLVRRFAAAYPGVQVHLQSLESEAKAPGLLAGAVDLAFVRSTVHARGIRVDALWTEPLLAVVPAQVAAACPAGVVDPEILSGVPLAVIARASHPPMHDELVDQCRMAGVTSPLGPPLAGAREGLAVIAAGAGWTLVPASNAPEAMEGVETLRFADPVPTTTVSLMWRSTGASQHALAFARVARSTASLGELPT
jgi:DNA-binding transcriptional LysR family regulator